MDDLASQRILTRCGLELAKPRNRRLMAWILS